MFQFQFTFVGWIEKAIHSGWNIGKYYIYVIT